jgi:hypothetical protein
LCAQFDVNMGKDHLAAMGKPSVEGSLQPLRVGGIAVSTQVCGGPPRAWYFGLREHIGVQAEIADVSCAA